MRWVAGLIVLVVGISCILARPGQEVHVPVLEAGPLFGRATPTSITFTLLGGAFDVRARLWLRPEEGGPEIPVEFVGPLAEAGAPGPLWRGTLRGAVPVPGAGASVLVSAAGYHEFVLTGLREGAGYRYRLHLEENEPGERRGNAVRRNEWQGRFVTVRPRGSSFRFAVFSDPHFFVRELEPSVPRGAEQDPWYLAYALEALQWYRQTRIRVEEEYRVVAANINADRPDFVVGLGDHFDLHGLDFNAAFLTPSMALQAHAEARHEFVHLNEAGALYQVLGNWEGESGFHAPEHRQFAIDARKRYSVNPRPGMDSAEASIDEDYYTFRWGDVQCIALNVRGYTPTRHLLGGTGPEEGVATDFTLGDQQKLFLRRALRTSDALYKVILIHHAVGGNGGDADNSNYGRGGGRAAKVGEQAWVHELMQRHGVQIFFYGHDHVFTDMVVDGIHYTLPGTTGAPWRFEREVTGYETYWKESGHARVEVSPEKLRVEFVSHAGSVLHSYEVSPRRLSPDPAGAEED